MSSHLLHEIAVTKIFGAGAILTRQLVAWCGGVSEVFKTPKKELLKIPGIGEKTVNSILSKAAFKIAEEELKWIEKHNINTYFYLNENYPKRLAHFPDAPILLYYKGNMDLDHPRTVGIVGTRKPTEQGKIACEEIVEGLKPYGVSIISGLAYGVDITAHKKCLSLGIPTVGCLGHGLKMIYPKKHEKVALEMLENGGLLTEFSFNENPDAPHFPMRNRIIAGLSDALVVVETPKSGGSMISAHIANEYNKDVFAIPGRIKDEKSKGCNHLIKSHKAALAETAEDIAYVMRWEKGSENSSTARQIQLFVDLDDNEKIVVDALSRNDSIGIDSLSYQTHLSQSALAGILLGLEFKGVVKSLPGKRYLRV